MNFEGKWPRSLPDVLKPKPGPLSATHLKVYKDFMSLGNAPEPMMQNQIVGDGSNGWMQGSKGESTRGVRDSHSTKDAIKAQEDALKSQAEQQQQQQQQVG